jgi:hypothetical protein
MRPAVRHVVLHKPRDTVVPTVAARTIPSAGTTLIVTFSERCQNGTGGAAGHALTASGGAVTATYASGSGSNVFTYTLNRTVGTGETVTHDYTQPGNGIEDLFGNDLATFATQTVTNTSTSGTNRVLREDDSLVLREDDSYVLREA